MAALGAAAVAAALVGVRDNRPRRRWPWLLAAAGLGLSGSASIVYYLDVGAVGTPAAATGPASLLFLASTVVIAAGTAGLAWVSMIGRGRTLILDSMILTSGLGLLVWKFIIFPQWGYFAGNWEGRLTAFVFPLCDVLIFAITASLVLVAWRVPAVLMLAAAAAGQLSSDLVLAVARSGPDPQVSFVVLAGWVVFYLGWGLAALHPSMVRLTEPAPVDRREPGRGYRLLLISFIAVPFAVLFADIAAGAARQSLTALLFTALTLILVLIRLTGLIDDYRGVIIRSQAVHGISAAMFTAADHEAVLDVLRDSPGRLLPPGTAYAAYVDQPGPDRPSAVAALPDGDARPLYVRDLPDRARTRMGRHPVALVCPITTPGHRASPTENGALVVGAAESGLAQIQTSVQLLTAHAALAAERIDTTAELDLRHSEEYFQTLVRNTADVILILEPDRDTIRYASPSAARTFGTDALAGRKFSTLSRPVADTAGTRGRPAEGQDLAVARPDQATVIVETSWQDLRDDPTISGWVLTLRDVTASRKLEAELTYLAYHDPLTELANRSLFGERLQAALADADRTGTTVGVLYLDLDDFKMVNDSYGHETGDALLQAAARRLSGALRPGDLAARLGGDEFAALIAAMPSVEEVEAVADDIVTAMAQPFLVDGRMLPGAVSVGIATSRDSIDAATLLRKADQAQYAAKSSGKRQWRRYDPAQHDAMLDRVVLRTELGEAIEGRSLTVEYQPIVELSTDTVAGFEALVRWDHPTRGRLMPDQFIDLAEEAGLMDALGHHVLQAAIETAAGWQRSHHPRQPPYVSVNVSVSQFHDPDFSRTVRAALDGAGLPPQRLLLEITESLLLHHDDQTWQALTELRREGIRIAIDDFGTGYSALSYLRQSPVDILKIDRSFTSTTTTSARQATLVDIIITLAHALDLNVVAEGIETTAERDLLRHFGCRYGQGYLYDRPLTRTQADIRAADPHYRR
ncbi:bifunctional diguanylate cyclase/phosphodiesterase [Catellatospora sp. TT07R-123]|uniref:putative bifunctional diguanylate cyclase/phosphodiesterase n=1 Tax=Catellatospora sp. TT07R-123 TaxID=2733863 RepID=UPI001BB40D9B|nr:EAL domain-containing protein [Catellatospora sp. TT07R-123]